MGQDVPSHPGPIPASHGTGMGPNFFSWDGMGPNLCGMGAPGPTPSQDRDRDGTRPWWDGSSHPGPAVSLAGLDPPLTSSIISDFTTTQSISVSHTAFT